MWIILTGLKRVLNCDLLLSRDVGILLIFFSLSSCLFLLHRVGHCGMATVLEYPNLIFYHLMKLISWP